MKVNYKFAFSLFLLVVATGSHLQAASLNVLYNFTTANNGGTSPWAGVVQGSDGNFYGTTIMGGSNTAGTVFKVTPAGTLTTLASFNGVNGEAPQSALVLGGDGNFYGTTVVGGSGSASEGTVFQMTPAGVLNSLVSFTGPNGEFPSAGLILGSDGNFYGTTGQGGSTYVSPVNPGDGTIFKITPAGVLTTLVSFNGANGNNPYGGVVQGSDGNFYGTTESGGSNNDGTVFMMTPSGVLTTLVSFTGANGDNPLTALVQGSDGNFYGTTTEGGSAHLGTVFKMTPAGVLTNLYSFSGADGQFPEAALVQGGDGNFYGTTLYGGSNNDGTVFEMTPAGVLTTLVSFSGANGSEPKTNLLRGADGNFYGTTQTGGSSNDGVFFQLIPPQPVPALPRWGWVVLGVGVFIVLAAFLKSGKKLKSAV